MVFVAAARAALVALVIPVSCLAGPGAPAGLVDTAVAVAGIAAATRPAPAFLGQQPVPKPFPTPGSAQPAPRTPTDPPKAPAVVASGPPTPAERAPTEATLGVPIYPGAQFIASYDAGRGQRDHIFGSATGFLDLVAYYRNALKQKGELVFDLPATHEFDVGKFREEAMSFPPGVTIKDYQSDVSAGYPNPRPGGQPARFPTLIQIVPVTER